MDQGRLVPPNSYYKMHYEGLTCNYKSVELNNALHLVQRDVFAVITERNVFIGRCQVTNS